MVEEGKTEIIIGDATKNLVITEFFDFPCS